MNNTANTALQTFDFSGLELRVIMRMAEPWFVATDVCRALGMDTFAGTSQWLTRLGSDEKHRVFNREHPELFSGSRAGSLNAVSESGLYKLVMRSDKPEARKFQDWVTCDVLPAIRKTGGYLLNEEARDTAEADDRQDMPMPELFAQIIQQQAETNQPLATLFSR